MSKQRGILVYLEEAIEYLLEESESKENFSFEEGDIKKDRKAFIELLKRDFFGCWAR